MKNVNRLEKEIIFLNPQIKISDISRENTKEITPFQFLSTFLQVWNNVYPTVYVENDLQQCETKCRRSLGDLFMLTKYYFPEITLLEVITILHDLFNGEYEHFCTDYCGVINKRVYYYNTFYNTKIEDRSIKDELGVRYREYEKLVKDSRK